MRLVQIRDGHLEVRWTWLPYWLAVNPKLKTEVERGMRDAVLLGGVTTSEDDLDALHSYVVDRFSALFPVFEGLGRYLDALRGIPEPTAPPTRG